MRGILVLLIAIVLINPVYGKDKVGKYDIQTSTDKFAQEILYTYILKDLNKTPQELMDFAKIDRNSVKAFFADLNDDGENEIIGVVYSTYYWGTAGYSLFILQKDINGYKNITYALNFEPQEGIYVLNRKTTGYKNIKIYGSSSYKFQPFVIKFKNGLYQNENQTKSLEKILLQ